MNTNVKITTSILMLRGELKSLQLLVRKGFAELGLQEIDGVPLEKWDDAHLLPEFEKMMLDVGDKNPAAYESIRACIDALHKQPGS